MLTVKLSQCFCYVSILPSKMLETPGYPACGELLSRGKFDVKGHMAYLRWGSAGQPRVSHVQGTREENGERRLEVIPVFHFALFCSLARWNLHDATTFLVRREQNRWHYTGPLRAGSPPWCGIALYLHRDTTGCVYNWGHISNVSY